MDPNTPVQPQINDNQTQNESTVPTTPSPDQPGISPLQKYLDRISNIFAWAKTHKREVLVAIAVVFLFVIIIFSIYATFKERLFPSKDTQQENKNADTKTFNSSMKLTTNKDSYSISEKVLVTISANSEGQAVRAFDALFVFDPEYVSLTTQRKPLLPDFMYYYNAFSESSVQISAVQQGKDLSDQIFKDTSLFQFELTIKKVGSTTLGLSFDKQSTDESNLLNSESVDMLSTVKGAKIEIK